MGLKDERTMTTEGAWYWMGSDMTRPVGKAPVLLSDWIKEPEVVAWLRKKWGRRGRRGRGRGGGGKGRERVVK